MIIERGSWLDKAFVYIEEFSEDYYPIKINRVMVGDIALKALKCLQVALMVASFYSRPQTFAIGSYIGAFSPVIFPKLKDIIRKIESLVDNNLHWGFPVAGAVIFSILPSAKWPLATIVSSTYFGYKLFAVPVTERVLLEASSDTDSETIPIDEKSQSRFTRIKLQTWRLIRDNGIRILDISAFLFLFALKPVVLPIAFVGGAVLPGHAKEISKQVSLIWKYNRTRFILFHLTIPLILPTYLWIAATIYGLHKGVLLAEDTFAKQQQHQLEKQKKCYLE